ncbi:hypothetical protein AB6A40_008337 [Gnathostoma spinigerum]|uniref:Uncharacterized protein n=1 Tax=Gnathostoma spinigerum TaxID=75299 RepID=A0ABD6EX30_9BILA
MILHSIKHSIPNTLTLMILFLLPLPSENAGLFDGLFGGGLTTIKNGDQCCCCGVCGLNKGCAENCPCQDPGIQSKSSGIIAVQPGIVAVPVFSDSPSAEGVPAILDAPEVSTAPPCILGLLPLGCKPVTSFESNKPSPLHQSAFLIRTAAAAPLAPQTVAKGVTNFKQDPIPSPGCGETGPPSAIVPPSKGCKCPVGTPKELCERLYGCKSTVHKRIAIPNYRVSKPCIPCRPSCGCISGDNPGMDEPEKRKSKRKLVRECESGEEGCFPIR